MLAPMYKWGLDTRSAPPPVLASLEPIVRFFSYHDAHPVALSMVLMEKFGADWLEWEPRVLKDEIITVFRATSISEHNWQKIQAVRTMTAAVGFWNDWGAFEKIIQSLNNNVPRFDICQRCTIAQLMSGVTIANKIREEKFSEEVSRYTAACSIDEGVTYLPPPLDFAQEVLSHPMYRCRRCGNVDTDDLDGKCDFCSGRFQDGRPLNFKPNKNIPEKFSTNVEKFLLRGDPSPVEKRFLAIKNNRAKDKELRQDNAVDVQAAKLMVAYDYTMKREQELVEQLEELKSWVTH